MRVWNGYQLAETDSPEEGDVVLRPTLMLDSAGDEIFECDIISIEIAGATLTGVVEFEEKSASFLIRTTNDVLSLDATHHPARIIGNAFEPVKS